MIPKVNLPVIVIRTTLLPFTDNVALYLVSPFTIMQLVFGEGSFFRT